MTREELKEVFRSAFYRDCNLMDDGDRNEAAQELMDSADSYFEEKMGEIPAPKLKWMEHDAYRMNAETPFGELYFVKSTWLMQLSHSGWKWYAYHLGKEIGSFNTKEEAIESCHSHWAEIWKKEMEAAQ